MKNSVPTINPHSSLIRPALFILFQLGLALASVVPGASTAQEPERPEILKKLERLTGTWSASRVEFVAPDGSLAGTSSATSHNEFELGGNVMVHQGRLAEPSIETRGWYFISPADGRLHMGSVSTSGRYDEFVGGWQGKSLVMVSIPGRSTGERLFRMTHANITVDAYDESLEVSDDGGKTWRVTSRQTMRRLEPEDILAAMQPFIGQWRSEEKTGRDGARLHFEYDLRWLDAEKTIARMLITQIDAAGNRSVVFEGYKGLAPAGEVYYHAASPSGRSSRGIVILEDDRLVTAYDGWTAEGNVVEIRDVFEPATADAFTSRTYLRRPGDPGWREIGVDHWTRISVDN